MRNALGVFSAVLNRLRQHNDQALDGDDDDALTDVLHALLFCIVI